MTKAKSDTGDRIGEDVESEMPGCRDGIYLVIRAHPSPTEQLYRGRNQRAPKGGALTQKIPFSRLYIDGTPLPSFPQLNSPVSYPNLPISP
ncbi:MAG: hypothetical protein Q9181_004994 [Wetmoreana brouardii]